LDERKSWSWLIFAYSGVGIAVLAIGFFIARSAAHGGTIVAHADATATPSTIGVYSGIAPDATATPTPAVRPSPSASASASATPAPSPSPRASAHATTADPHPKLAAAPQRKHRKGRSSKLVASTGTSSDAAAQDPAEDPGPAPERVVAPVRTAAPAAAVQPAPVPAATQAPAATPPPVIVAQALPNEPIFAPERIVDAQVRVAVQPDESDADRERGAHGTSVILVTIDPKGNVVSAAVGTSSGYASLDRDALAAARASEFVPPKINGRAATETYRLVYDFGQ
jgi:TonB family protein